MIQAEIGGHGFEPAASGRALAEFGKARVSLQEDFLRDILGFGVVGDQAHSRAEYHVLVVLHERFKLFWIRHRRAMTTRSELKRPRGGRPESRSISCHIIITRQKGGLFQKIPGFAKGAGIHLDEQIPEVTRYFLRSEAIHAAA
jgi:hypothetical protein